MAEQVRLMRTIILIILSVVVAIMAFNFALIFIGGVWGWVVAIAVPFLVGFGVGLITQEPKWMS